MGAGIALVPAPLGGEADQAAPLAAAHDPIVDDVGNIVVTVDDDADGESLTFLVTMDDLDTVAVHPTSCSATRPVCTTTAPGPDRTTSWHA